MNQSALVWLLLALMLLAANLPYLSNRILLVGPYLKDKPFAWRALELCLLAALSLSAGMLFESHVGQRHPQRWEFYAAVLCLFVTLGFPGFVWRYLRRGRHED
jgi:hypothetical protein